MYTINIGLFPFAGLVLGGSLYAIYHYGLRLKCPARVAQTFILMTIIVMTLFSWVSFSYITEPTPLELANTHSKPKQSTEIANTSKVGSDVPNTNILTAVNKGTSLSPTDQYDSENHRQQLFHAILSDVFPMFGTIYLLGVLAMLGYFILQIAYLYQFRKKQKLIGCQGGAAIYEMARVRLPFSFGQNIFLPTTLADNDYHHVMAHELSHVRHHHSAWSCLMELMVCLNWYNPFAWMMFSEMRLQQELEVDTDVLSSGIDREQYQMSLLSISTQHGKWLLTQQAFIGEPLKKRLLFMNTTINPRRATIQLLTAAVTTGFLLTSLVVVSCEMRKQERQHPLQGCWIKEMSPNENKGNDHAPSEPTFMFFGDYGELVLSYDENDSVNIPGFRILGIEQQIVGDTIKDKRGEPIRYSLDGETLTFPMFHFNNEEHPDGMMSTWKWRKAAHKPPYVALFQAICTPSQTAGSHGMNGVWAMDSLKIWVSDHPEDVCNIDQDFLIIRDSIYMRFTYVTDNITNPYINFLIAGDGGDFRVNGDFLLQGRPFKAQRRIDNDHLFISPDPEEFPSSNGYRIDFYYHRIEMPEFIPRLFRPALI